MSLEYEALKQLEHLKVQLVWTGPDAGGKSVARTWTGMIEGDFNVSGSASYSSPYEEMAQKLSQTLRGVTSAASTVTNQLPDEIGGMIQELQSTQVKNPSMTSHLWEASERPSLPVTFTMLNYKEGMDVGRDATDLWAKCYPTKGVGGLYKAPGGYRVDGTTAVGTWSIRIGRWFQAFNLNLTSVDVVYSQTQVSDGPTDIPRPLTATVSAVLVPFQAPTEDVIKNYYRIA